ncbi:c-type cytochrome [Ruegeria atlantica]|uniref:c-type cytochrome n=1 Tax=Ruegeria atlantica TaxID=81569 RepID=UPI00147B282E|nr:c-type cytochrome [Ruegeria atlantica]
MAKIIPAIIATATLLATNPAFSEGDPENGRNLVRTNCAHCHGVDGNARSTSFQPVPMLAGQPSVYLVQEMRNYASGAREDNSKNAAMVSKLKELSDQEFQDIAEFFATQKRY